MSDLGIFNVVVVYPSFVARVVGRVDVNSPHAAFVHGQQGFEVVAVNDLVAGAGRGGALPRIGRESILVV